MINIENIIIKVLKEENMVKDALGAPAGGTSQFSGDYYAPGDSRMPHSLFGGVITRNGLNKSRKKRKKKRKKK